MAKIKFSNLTAYPSIFSGSDWGKNIYSGGIESLATICGNRNAFKTSFAIKKYCRLASSKYNKIKQEATVVNQLGGDIRQNIEYYKSADNSIIALFSGSINDEQHLRAVDKGYTLVDALFWPSQKTYLKIIYSNSNFNQAPLNYSFSSIFEFFGRKNDS